MSHIQRRGQPGVTGPALLQLLLLLLLRRLLLSAGLALPGLVLLPCCSGSGLPAPPAASGCCAASLSTWVVTTTQAQQQALSPRQSADAGCRTRSYTHFLAISSPCGSCFMTLVSLVSRSKFSSSFCTGVQAAARHPGQRLLLDLLLPGWWVVMLGLCLPAAHRSTHALTTWICCVVSCPCPAAMVRDSDSERQGAAAAGEGKMCLCRSPVPV